VDIKPEHYQKVELQIFYFYIHEALCEGLIRI